MFREFLKEQIRKTGMIRSLEIDNSKLRSSLKSLKTDNENLKKKVELLEGSKIEISKPDPKNFTRGVSTDAGKPAILKYILENIGKHEKILDVGFGSGLYCKMLRAFNYKNIDGIDIYDAGIVESGLDKIYNHIYIGDILDFDFEYYDLIIFGDVLEHIELDKAKKLLYVLIKENKCKNMVVSIPYEYEQEEQYGNKYEKHLQSQVNKEFMEEHYPYLELIDSSIIPNKGSIIATYIWKKTAVNDTE
jgi:2-polyprenyl-3-methyl-5-hydroxy-6-metoxy-1,4-benzoquinol methylase